MSSSLFSLFSLSPHWCQNFWNSHVKSLHIPRLSCYTIDRHFLFITGSVVPTTMPSHGVSTQADASVWQALPSSLKSLLQISKHKHFFFREVLPNYVTLPYQRLSFYQVSLLQVAIYLYFFLNNFINFYFSSHQTVNSTGAGSRPVIACPLTLVMYHRAWPIVCHKQTFVEMTE